MASTQTQRTVRWRPAVAAAFLVLSVTACGGRAEPTPTPTPVPTATPTPAPTPTPTPSAAAGEAAAAARSGSEIVTTEQQLNEMLQQSLASQQDLPISELIVDLKPGLITGSGKLALGFLNADAALSLRLNAVEGKVIPEIVEILLNGEPAPAMLQGQVDALITPLIEQASSADYGFYVESVEITDTEIRISAR